MSHRSYQEQVALEEEGFAEFERKLGPAAYAAYRAMSGVEVANKVACDYHSAGLGKRCDQRFYCCEPRRIAAAKAKAGTA